MPVQKYLILTLSGAAGYMFYPALAPALFGIDTPKPQTLVEDEIEPELLPKPQIKKAPPKPVAKKAPKKPPVVEKPTAPEPMQKEEKVAEVPQIVTPDVPAEPAEPDLTSNDLDRIINEAVETGKWIDFRKDNIIEWKLLKQNFTRLDSDYQGEVSVEIGNLFGKSIRKAKVMITDKKVTQWVWMETE